MSESDERGRVPVPIGWARQAIFPEFDKAVGSLRKLEERVQNLEREVSVKSERVVRLEAVSEEREGNRKDVADGFKSKIDDRHQSLEERVGRVEERFNKLLERAESTVVDKLEELVDSLENDSASKTARIDQIEDRVREIERFFDVWKGKMDVLKDYAGGRGGKLLED